MEFETIEIEIIEPEPGESQLLREIAETMTRERIDLYRQLNSMTDAEIEKAIDLFRAAE